MSETAEPPVTDAPAPAETVTDAVDAPVEQQATETPTEPVEPAPKKPNPADRRFAHLTARNAALQAERDQAVKEAEAARALLDAPKGDEPPKTTVPQTSVEEAAQRLVAEREFNSKLTRIDARGKKEFGAEAWENAKSTLTGLGATSNQPFLQALAETDHPQKIFAALAEDSDALVELLGKSPAAMAAQLGRMDAKMETPPPKPLSAAPKPAAPIQSGGVTKEIDPWGPEAENLSMAEWNALAAKTDLGKRIFGMRR